MQTILFTLSAAAAANKIVSSSSPIYFSNMNLREKVPNDIAIVMSVLPPGEDLAGAYVADASKSSAPVKRLEGDDYISAVASSYVRADFNHDGRMDLAVLTEGAPGTSADHATSFGDRTLRVYLADSSDRLRLIDQSTRVILRADAGGLMGDPNGGLSLEKNDVLIVTNRGGAGQDSWINQQLFRVQHGEVRFIGRRDSDFNTVKGVRLNRVSISTPPLLTLGKVPDLF